jgi:hypothetical protein
MSWFYVDTSPVITLAQLVAMHLAPHADLPAPIKAVAAITQPAACGDLPMATCARQMGDGQDNLKKAYEAPDPDTRRTLIVRAVKEATTPARGTDWREAWEKANARLVVRDMPPAMLKDYERALGDYRDGVNDDRWPWQSRVGSVHSTCNDNGCKISAN